MLRNILSLFGLGARQTNRRSTKRRTSESVSLQLETLEDRAVPAGVVYGQSVFDASAFAANIESLANGNAVGYGYAINENGVIVEQDGNGQSRTSFDAPETDFTAFTDIEIASVSKPITAVAVLNVLEERITAGDFADLDEALSQPLMNYLPSNWDFGQNFDLITIRHALAHQSGFREILVNDGNFFDGDNPFGSFAFNTDANLQAVAESDFPANIIGQWDSVTEDWSVDVYNYSNANFSIFRLVLPSIRNGTATTGAQAASEFKEYIQDEILEPMGIWQPDMVYPGGTNPAMGYFLGVDASGYTPGDSTSTGGGFGWKLSAHNLGEFLLGLRYDNSILSPVTRATMDAQELGIFQDSSEVAFGTFLGHNGSQGTGSGEMNSGVVVFPNGVEASFVMNSEADNLPGGGTTALLKEAFMNAFPELTVDGTFGDDTFTLRRDPGNASKLELWLNGVEQFSLDVSTLDSLTLLGGFGNDTFVIEDVPSSLELVLNGGMGNDTFQVGDNWFDINIDGDVSVQGGIGADSLILTDRDNVGDDTYNFTETHFDKSYYNGTFEYAGVETIDVRGGEGNESYYLWGSPAGADVILRGGNGDDQFHVGGFDISHNIGGNVGVLGEAGTDTLELHDGFGNGTNDVYSILPNYFDKTDFGGIVTFDAMQMVTLNANGHNNTVHVHNTDDFRDITINGRNGNDHVLIHATGAASDVYVNGGSGTDLVELAPGNNAQDLDTIGGLVVVDGGTGMDSVVIHDQLDLGNDTYTIDEDSFDKTSFARMEYVGVEDLELHANDSDNTVRIEGLAIDTSWKVYTGLGEDTVEVGYGSRDLDTYLKGDLALYGGGFGFLDKEVDTLIFQDGQDTGNDTYQLSSNSFTKSVEFNGSKYSLLENWFYSGFEDLTLNANAYDNTIEISSLYNFHRTMPVTINAFSGDDELVLGAAANRIDLIREPIHFNGALGTDVITVHDENSPMGRTYSFVSQTFDVSGNFSSLSYTSVKTVEVSAGAFNDMFDVQSSVISTDLILNGGNGNDTFELASGTHDLDSVGGAVTVHGGGGFGDTILVQDDLDAGNDDYAITGSWVSGGISKANFDLHYSSSESVILNANDYNNDIDIESIGVFTNLEVNANGGDDAIRLSPDAKDLGTLDWYLNVDGGEGTDYMYLYDQYSGSVGPYWMTDSEVSRSGWLGADYTNFESVSWQLNAGANTFNLLSTQQGTNVFVNGRQGDDVFNVTAPSSYVTIFGSTGSDTMNFIGTEGDDEIGLRGEIITLDTGTVSTGSVEQRSVDGTGGSDLAMVDGVDGVLEMFHIQAAPVAGSGTFTPGPFSPIDFQNLEMFDVAGDAGDEDELTFEGTANADHFDIDLGAAGTSMDPVIQLRPAGAPNTSLLTVRNFSEVGVPTVNGVGGNDTFEVAISEVGSRDIHVDGGLGNDTLDVTYVDVGADLDWLYFPQDPEDGIIQVDYGFAISTIGYQDFETVDVTAV